MQRGDRVRHAVFGSGRVLSKQAHGRTRVLFDEYASLPHTVERTDLELLNSPDAAVSAPVPVPRERSFRARLGTADAWQTLEALRLGVVPARGVRDYTIAREAELESLHRLLEVEAGCRVVWGDYGCGKTHLCDATEQLALEQGFAVVRITLDPRERALHHPLRLWQAIADSVRTADQVHPGIEHVLERLVDSPAHTDPNGDRASRFFSPYLHALKHGDEEQIGWLRDWIRGDNIGSDEINSVLGKLRWRGARALRFPDYRTFGRMYVHLIGTLGCWCRDAGARGLVMVFDEVERVDTLSPKDRSYAFEVLRHLAAVTMREADLAFDPEELYKGGHAVHRAIPIRFAEEQPLISIFAMTPLEDIREEFAGVTKVSDYDLTLAPLERGHLEELVARVAALYEEAHPGHQLTASTLVDVRRELEGAFDSGYDNFRSAIRAAVFLLDADRLGPVAQPSF